MNTIHYTCSNHGTAAFPIWTVRRDVWDADGYDLEHLSEVVANFTTQAAAEAKIQELEAQ